MKQLNAWNTYGSVHSEDNPIESFGFMFSSAAAASAFAENAAILLDLLYEQWEPEGKKKFHNRAVAIFITDLQTLDADGEVIESKPTLVSSAAGTNPIEPPSFGIPFIEDADLQRMIDKHRRGAALL